MNLAVTSFAHHYIGCPFVVSDNEGKIYGDTVSIVDLELGDIFGDKNLDWSSWEKNSRKIQLVLTHPSDMSARDKKEYYGLCKKILEGKKLITVDTPMSLLFLFEKHIDAFDLIENGTAMDLKEYKRLKKEKKIIFTGIK